MYKLRKVDNEKQKRINSFKMKLNDAETVVHETITQKTEKVQSFEETCVRERKKSAGTVIAYPSPRDRLVCVKLLQVVRVSVRIRIRGS